MSSESNNSKAEKGRELATLGLFAPTTSPPQMRQRGRTTQNNNNTKKTAPTISLLLRLLVVVVAIQLPAACHALSSTNTNTKSTPDTRTLPTTTNTNPQPPTFPIHTLLLCRHGDSIWNGGEPGCRETFTGWSDVPLSQRGIREARATGDLLSNSYQDGIDVCCTSILGRAQLTAHYCLWGFAEKPSHEAPRQYVTDYRLNERHYGALQGLVKQDVESGVYGHDPKKVNEWRRGWHAVPPLLEDDDERRLAEIKKYQHYCGGPERVPRGESLAMVAQYRIQPFLDQRLAPLLKQAAERRNDGLGGTGLVVAHANSLRALIGVLCRVEENPDALAKLEAMKIPTGVPMMVRFQETKVKGRYRALPNDPATVGTPNTIHAALPYLSSSILPNDDNDEEEQEEKEK